MLSSDTVLCTLRLYVRKPAGIKKNPPTRLSTLPSKKYTHHIQNRRGFYLMHSLRNIEPQEAKEPRKSNTISLNFSQRCPRLSSDPILSTVSLPSSRLLLEPLPDKAIPSATRRSKKSADAGRNRG